MAESKEQDFYCDEVLSGHTPVEVVAETENVLAFRHPRPERSFHVVVIPKRHVASLLAMRPEDVHLLAEMVTVIQGIAQKAVAEQGGCQVITNLGSYQRNKHLHWHVRSGDPVR